LDEAHPHSLARVMLNRYWTPLCARGIVVEMDILSPAEIEMLTYSCRMTAELLRELKRRVGAGTSTRDIDEWVREITKAQGGKPSQLGYKGFSGAVCTSVNDVVCHGIPKRKTVLRDGDIVNIDVTSEFNGFHGDTSETLIIGRASNEAKHVVDVALRCRDVGIA
jgi:methionyl aminopeptidase